MHAYVCVCVCAESKKEKCHKGYRCCGGCLCRIQWGQKEEVVNFY